MKSSKQSSQQMAEWDEVGCSSGTIPPQCVPITSLSGEYELDLGTPQSQYSTAGLLCGITATTGMQCASTASSLEILAQPPQSLSIFPASSTVRTSGTSKGPLAVEPKGTDGDGVTLGPSYGHAAMVTRFFQFVSFLSWSPVCRVFLDSALGTVWNDKSVLGETRGATPLVIPVRGFVDDVPLTLEEDANCVVHKVSTYSRTGAVAKFRKHLESDLPVRKSVWTLSGLRLVCHCTLGQECHGGIRNRFTVS